jgi:subtilisin-like proprotein convertase family protein
MNTQTSPASSIEILEPRIAPAGFIVASGGGVVKIFANNDGTPDFETKTAEFAPFLNYKGPVSVAMGDFDGDGNDELITGKAAGRAALVRIWDLTTGGAVAALLDEVNPFPTAKNAGVSVAAGDLNGDAVDELIIGAGPGGPANVAIYSDINRDGRLSDTLIDTFLAFPAPFAGGVKVASANVNNTGGDDVVAGMWSRGGTISTFADTNANRIISDDNAGAPLESFKPFGANYRAGLNVAAGAIQNAGGSGAEVMAGVGSGKPKVIIFTDANANGLVGDEAPFDTLLPAGPGLTSGAVVAAGDTDNSSFFVEVIVGPARAAASHVKVFDDTADAGVLLSDNATSFEFNPFTRAGGALNLAFGKVLNATFASTGFPSTIPDVATITSSIFVPAGTGRITDLDVSINLFHSFDGDLDVTLTHVATGTTVTLFQDVGGTNEGFIIRLNDEAGTDITTASNPKVDGPITGTFNPGGAALLSLFEGENLAGEWRLTITDDSAGDTGTLFSWALHASV